MNNINQLEILNKIETIIGYSVFPETILINVFKDSLHSLDIINEIEDTFDIVIPINIISGIKTVSDLISYIEICINDK